jgi:hypothetical protein
MKYGRRLRIEHFDIVREPDDIEGPPGEFGFVNCAEVSAAHCRQGSFGFGGCSHSAFVEDLTAVFLGGEEYCFDIYLSHVLVTGTFRFSGDPELGGSTPCRRIFVTDSVFNGATVSICDESQFNNVTFVNTPPTGSDNVVFANANSSAMVNVTSELPIHFRGQSWRLANITAPKVVFENYSAIPSSGLLLTPLIPDTGQVVYDTTGQWQRPLLVNMDGTAEAPQSYQGDPPALVTPGLILPSPAPDVVPLTVKAEEDQAADLQQWQDEAANLKLAVRADGNLKTANAEDEPIPENQRYRLAIYDEDDNLLGYIPIYSSGS